MTEKSSWMLGRSSALALLFAAAAAPAALAQQATPPAPAAPAASESEEVIITGSHVGHTSFNSPTPVNTIDAQRMQDLAVTNVGDALNQLPSFRAITAPATPLFRVSGAIGARSLDLRGLGQQRTLVLVDGRRFVPSQDNDTIDLNAIPSAMVKRAEVVTGGASAAYGADAVAGVVNLILDTHFSGFKTDFSYGISAQNDDQNFAGSVVGGSDFAGSRGHFVAGVEYQDERGVGGCDTRAYCHNYENYIANPGWNANPALSNGLPATLVLPHILFVENPVGILTGAKTSGGFTLGQQVNNTGTSALPAALRGLQFNAAGTALVPFQFGNFLSGLFMQGGDPSVNTLYGFGDDPLVTPTSHISTLEHFDYDLTDKVTLTGEFMFSHVEGGPVQGSVLTETPAGGSVGLNINNPFISPTVRAQILAADPTITSILVNVGKSETGPRRRSDSSNNIWRGVLALNGEVFDGWNWDLSYTHGETSSTTTVRNNDLKIIDVQAADAITPPVGYTGPVFTTPLGAPVICRSSATNPADGCIPANFLGANSLTPAVLAKYYATEFQTRTITQDAFAGNLRGTLFNLPAGPLEGAIGAEFRRDSAVGDTDPLTLQGAFTAAQTTALPRVTTEVTEEYVEANVPVLRDVPLAHSLTVDGAYRWTHYSSSGSAETWKVGVVYEPVDDILFRITRSSDIRAPTPAELNPNTITTLLPLTDPFNGNVSHQIANVTGGNPNLGLETADTKTFGVVLQPHFVPHFRLSLDYYDISVDGGIDTVSAPAVLTACATQNRLCNLITFSGAFKASPAASIAGNFQNLATIHAEGYELVSQYTISDVLGGSVDLDFNANYVEDLHSVGGTGLVTRLDGVTGNAGSLTSVLGVPSWKIDALVTYSRDSWSVTAHGRYIPESILDPTKLGPKDEGFNINLPNSANINTVSSAFYLDLSGTYRPQTDILGGRVELYGAINNITDQFPPSELRFFGNPLHYDVVGRAFRVGLRTHW